MFQKIRKYLQENRWKTVYFTQDTEEYAKVKGQLNDAGIPSNTKSSTPDGAETSEFYTSYDLRVKQKDIHKAQQAIHKKN